MSHSHGGHSHTHDSVHGVHNHEHDFEVHSDEEFDIDDARKFYEEDEDQQEDVMSQEESEHFKNILGIFFVCIVACDDVSLLVAFGYYKKYVNKWIDRMEKEVNSIPQRHKVIINMFIKYR